MSILLSLAQILAATAAGILTLGMTLWMAGALYFDVGRGSTLGKFLAAAWVLGVAAGFLLLQPWWQPFVLVLTLFVLFLGWWFSQTPSNNRDWEPNFARLARVDLEGDVVTVHNVRHTEYRSLEDYTP